MSTLITDIFKKVSAEPASCLAYSIAKDLRVPCASTWQAGSVISVQTEKQAYIAGETVR